MSKIVVKKVFLQYGLIEQRVAGCQNGPDDANKFVAFDTEFGDYPFKVEIDHAHDFGTAENAIAYSQHYKSDFFEFIVRNVTVTYEF